jgi:probable sporulation protein (polysaccharide deacetylase family)
MKRFLTHLPGVSIILFAIIYILLNRNIGQYIYTATVASNSSLYHEIKSKSQKYYLTPQDAKIDRVWKAIPGINGREVNIKASYEKMKKYGTFDENKLVFRQIVPKVHLKDLSPAPIYRGNPEKKMIALTVNVAWGEEFLPQMLQSLKNSKAKATFFLEGNWTKNHPNQAKIIVESGFEVGNHSYSHPDMSRLSKIENINQLEKTNKIIEAVTNQKVRWFAPPSGSWNPEVVKEVKDMGMETILWTADTIDWQKPSSSTIVERIIRKAENGVIVLMHPTKQTAQALPVIIEKLQEKGYKLVDITTLFDESRE